LVLSACGSDRELTISEVRLTLERCSDDGAEGKVVNNSDVRVDIFIDIEYLSDSGTVIDTGFASVSGLRPGQTSEWDSSFFGYFDSCRAEVSSVSES
jgi:hypothetical protein